MSTWTNFHVKCCHNVGIEFIILDIALQNRVSYTQDVSFLNDFENVLTNKNVLKMRVILTKRKSALKPTQCQDQVLRKKSNVMENPSNKSGKV